MNTLDQTIAAFAAREVDPAAVVEAQRKLEAAIAARPALRIPRRRVGGWIMAASATAVAVIALWMPLHAPSALAFSAVQDHFRDFATMRFDMEQRVNGSVTMTSRVYVTRDGKARTDVGSDLSVVVDPQKRRVLTLVHPPKTALVTELAAPSEVQDALAWLEEIRTFQGMARQLPDTRVIDGREAHGWELANHGHTLVLWATKEGLPLQMLMNPGAELAIDFRFGFNEALDARLFSTDIPAGYRLAAPDED